MPGTVKTPIFDAISGLVGTRKGPEYYAIDIQGITHPSLVECEQLNPELAQYSLYNGVSI